MKLNEVRKEDDPYFQGAFWIKGNSVRDIKLGRFEIIGPRFLTDYEGNYQEEVVRKEITHKELWKHYAKELSDKPYNYLPRGRVGIYKGEAYINLHSLFNQYDIIDAIIEKYCLQKLEINVKCDDILQGSHYDFLLE